MTAFILLNLNIISTTTNSNKQQFTNKYGYSHGYRLLCALTGSPYNAY